MSRPKKEVPRSELIRIKMTKKEKELLRKEAEKEGISMSEFIRRKLYA